MVISDESTAAHYLERIGYYRLGGYCKTFQLPSDPNHRYRAGVSFDDVLNLYVFDRKLRLLVLDAIERIEVAVRGGISNAMSLRYGPHWFMDPAHFAKGFDHITFLKGIEDETGKHDLKKRSPFSTHYYSKYNRPDLPPSWMVVETLSFGVWSKVYSNLIDNKVRAAIAKGFIDSASIHVFESWIRALTVLRNICAHHSLLWCRVFDVQPQMVVIGGVMLHDTSRFFAFAGMIQRLLVKVAPDSAWAVRLFELINENPSLPIEQMGFRQNWHKSQFWKIPQTGQ